MITSVLIRHADDTATAYLVRKDYPNGGEIIAQYNGQYESLHAELLQQEISITIASADTLADLIEERRGAIRPPHSPEIFVADHEIASLMSERKAVAI